MKRLLSILLFCAMVLTMLPAPAFAEDVCTCTDPCTAENMNSACPVCSAAGAAPENCAQAANLSDETPDPNPVTQFTVTWDGNGGTVNTSGATGSAAYGTAINPPANTPTRAADSENVYFFDGWYTEAEGGEKVTDFGTVQGDVTYYAHWIPAPVFDPARLDIKVSCDYDESHSTVVHLADLDPSEYTVSGPVLSADGKWWSYDVTLNDPAAYFREPHLLGDTGHITPATKKYAVSDGEINCLDGNSCVTCKPNTIRYLPDDYSTGSIPADTKEIGTSIRLSYETFTREGYRQTGWATEKDGPQIYIPGELYAKNEDLTLYPCWERIYTTDIPAVIEVRQGGELAPGKTDFELLIRSLNGHVLASGVFFDNLFPATDGVGTYHSPIRASGSENDLAFLSDGVLVWQRKSADTRWSCSDAIYYVCLFPTATPYAAAEPAAEPAPDYQYEIHPVQVVDGQYIPLDETVSAMTFVNTYTENAPRFTVTVENDGHGTGAADPAEAPAGTQITLTAAPNKGYVFKEWKVVSGGVTVERNGFTMPSGNVTVKAVFEKAGKLDNVPKTGDTDISPLPFFFAAAIAAVLLFPKKKQD